MFRRVYLDFIKNKISDKDLIWLFKSGFQYFLIHMSYLTKRPLCGPAVGFLITNYTCNYHCRMCDLPLRDKELRDNGLKELTTPQLKQILKDFADLGVSGIGFTGGEPLLRKDIFELLKYAKDLDLIVNFNTNGFYLDREAARKLFDCGVDSVNISLDGANKNTHDAIRRYNGAFDKAIGAIENINAIREGKKSKPRLKVIMVINEKNIREVTDLIKFAVDLQVDCVEFIPEQPFYVKSVSTVSPYNHIFLEKLRKNITYLLNFDQTKIKIENSPRHLKLFEKSFKNKKTPFDCYAGYNSCAVDCYGQVYPCVPWVNLGKTAGTIVNARLSDIWYSAGYNKIRKDISECNGCYLNCQAELNLLFKIGNV